jgi:predicted secreted protein
MGSEADDAIELRVGEERTVILPGLGTAGYRWAPHLEGDPGVAKVHPAGGGAPAPDDAVGASADEAFAVHAIRPGSARIRFEQRRPWERDDAPPANERTIELKIS